MPCRGCASAIWPASAELAEAVRADLPAWNVNVFALSAAVAALNDTSDFAERARAENAERRADLAAVLSGLPGVEVFPSSANYVLFRWRGAPKDLYGILLRRFGIAVRDCSNYCGLDDGTMVPRPPSVSPRNTTGSPAHCGK